VTAPFAFLLLLAAASFYLRAFPGREGIRILGLIAGIGFCNSLLWFSLNASDSAALERFHKLLDPRIVSQGGIYGGHLSLAMFHHQTGLGRESPVELWEGYIAEYPEDIRGYVNAIRNMKDSSDDRLADRIARWGGPARGREKLTGVLFRAYFEAGNLSMEEGVTERAGTLYEAALGIDPGSAPVWNNLGILRARIGDPAGAAEMFERSIVLDSGYAEAYFNLGRAYGEIGKRDRARWAFGEAARRGNVDAREYLEGKGVFPE